MASSSSTSRSSSRASSAGASTASHGSNASQVTLVDINIPEKTRSERACSLVSKFALFLVTLSLVGIWVFAMNRVSNVLTPDNDDNDNGWNQNVTVYQGMAAFILVGIMFIILIYYLWFTMEQYYLLRKGLEEGRFTLVWSQEITDPATGERTFQVHRARLRTKVHVDTIDYPVAQEAHDDQYTRQVDEDEQETV